ncbi:hypothetical protein CCMA1212_001278 [Trichoderma ghanense]|uniref:Uncharacterized protein n=1 Tax=Trichoderma ghanense TaxID=65468 RepID=A0ABY2HGE9_9HYPO
MSQALIQRLAAKGRGLLLELEQAIDEKGQQFAPFPEIAPRYSTLIAPPWMPPLDDRTAKVVGANEQPSNGYQMVQVNSVPHRDPSPYTNYVHRNGRVILCMYNFAEMDANNENRMHWSDLMAVSASRVASVNGATSMEELEAIWRISIVNPETNAVIAAVDCRIFGSGSSKEETRYFDLTPEDGDEFFALLGTVHRKGPLRMLAAYPRFFGCKTIARVRVYPNDSPNLCWFLERRRPPDTPEDDTTPLSRKARRDRKKGRRSRQSQSSSVG